jgi:hypothetical protein
LLLLCLLLLFLLLLLLSLGLLLRRLLFLLLLRLSLPLLFRGTGLLLVLLLLCVRGSDDSEKHEQESRPEKSDPFHKVTSIAACLILLCFPSWPAFFNRHIVSSTQPAERVQNHRDDQDGPDDP